jgi:hypothetical protein
MFTHSAHSLQRAAQRGLSNEEIEYILWYGQRHRRSGVIIVYLRRRDIPATDLWRADVTRLEGTAVVFDQGRQGDILTVWRNRRNGLKHIRRKPITGVNPGMGSSIRRNRWRRWGQFSPPAFLMRILP